MDNDIFDEEMLIQDIEDIEDIDLLIGLQGHQQQRARVW